MIRVRRSVPAPPILLSRGKVQTKRDCAAYDAAPVEYRTGRKRFLDRGFYKETPVKLLLMQMHYGKCCYCETKRYDRGDLHVEHFRPKAGVRQSHDDKEERPGYYWLMYTWENLLLACPACNRIKGTCFPLTDPSLRARSHDDDLARETALLIDPTTEDPRDHIHFKDDAPYSPTESGRETIRQLSLARAELTEQRLAQLQVFKVHVTILQMQGAPELEGIRQEIARAVKEARDEAAQFSSMMNDYFASIGL